MGAATAHANGQVMYCKLYDLAKFAIQLTFSKKCNRNCKKKLSYATLLSHYLTRMKKLHEVIKLRS